VVNFRQCEDAVIGVADSTAGHAQSDLHCHRPVTDDTAVNAQSDLHCRGPVTGDTDTAGNAQSDLHCRGPVTDDTAGNAQSDLHCHTPVTGDTAGNAQSDLHCRGPVTGDTAVNAQNGPHCHEPVTDDTAGNAQSDLHCRGPGDTAGHAQSNMYCREPVTGDTAVNAQSGLHCHGPNVQSRQLQYAVTSVVTTRDCGTCTASDAVLNDVNEDENPEAGNGDSAAIQVAVTNNKGRWRHDKKQFCKFCMKALTNLSRHFITKHSSEPEVAALECIPLKSTRRKMHLRKLLNDGNYQHNVDVLAKGTGEIIPQRRPSRSSDYDQFILCKYCRAMFTKHCLRTHKNNCPFRPSSQTDESDYRCERSTQSGGTHSERNTAVVSDVSSKINCQITGQQRQAKKAAQDENPESGNGDSDKDSYTVRVAVANSKGHRGPDKKQFCKFCMKALTNLSRHFIMKHSSEPEVAALECMPLKSTRRKMHLRKLLNDGNYRHNVDVLAKGTGEIIPQRRPSRSSDYDQFILCKYCRGMFTKHCLRTHKKNCPFKPDSQTDESGVPVRGREDASKEEQHMTLSLSCDVDIGEYHCKLRACAGISK